MLGLLLSAHIAWAQKSGITGLDMRGSEGTIFGSLSVPWVSSAFVAGQSMTPF